MPIVSSVNKMWMKTAVHVYDHLVGFLYPKHPNTFLFTFKLYYFTAIKTVINEES